MILYTSGRVVDSLQCGQRWHMFQERFHHHTVAHVSRTFSSSHGGHSYQIARRNATLVGWLFLPSGKKVLRVAIWYLQGFSPFMPAKPPPYPPPRPSRYLHFSSAHGRCTTGVFLVGVGAHSPLAACTFK